MEDVSSLESMNREEMLLQEITEMFSQSNINTSNSDPNLSVDIQPMVGIFSNKL